jgi:hypothetical protein
MFHPLETDLSTLKDQELEDKILELNKKYFTAYRLGKPELLTQITTFITIYKDEMSKRTMKRLSGSTDDDLDHLINVN